MKRYDAYILNKLLDSYERSSLSRGTNQIHVSIAFPFNRKTIPEYFDESSLVFEDVHEQLQALEEKDLVRLVWKKGHEGNILQKCLLNTEKVGQAYRLAGRRPLAEKEREAERICRDCLVSCGQDREPLRAFAQFLLDRLEKGKSIQAYADLDQPDQLQLLLQMLGAVLDHGQQEPCFLREFSIQIFHDSKTAEKLVGKTARILAAFSPREDLQGLDPDQILAEYNIYRNPSWIMMKGFAGMEVGEQSLDLSKIPGGLAITDQAVPSVHWEKEKAPSVVLTIENLTSFHRFSRQEIDGGRVLCLYLGGYVNRIRREFLKELYRQMPDALYLHFGDIDCGGFFIYRHLRDSSGIPFETWHMDLQTYLACLPSGKALTEHDRRTLADMLGGAWQPEQKALFSRMLKEGRKIEQEAVSVD